MKLEQIVLLIRIFALLVLAASLTTHVRSVRVFRWEQSMSGGVLVTYAIAVAGLILMSATENQNEKFFQVYICTTGTLLLCINAGGIYRRWRMAGQLTRVVAEFLGALGVPLHRQVMTKVYLSLVAGLVIFVDLVITAVLQSKPESEPSFDYD